MAETAIKLEPQPNSEHAMVPEKTRKPRIKTNANTTKTIRAPGLSIARVAQACDRCRAKKSRCDGKLPACSSCAAIGIKCIVSDKLSRRAYPKGYTETLEERVRQLENEIRKLQGIVDLRDEQIALSAANGFTPSELLRTDSVLLSQNPPVHTHELGCICCNGPHSVHDRPVSIAGSLYESESISVPASVVGDLDDEQSLLSLDSDIESNLGDSDFTSFAEKPFFLSSDDQPAPGAFAAATAFERMNKNHDADDEDKKHALTSLVATAIPRSTEESLFVPTLLARICQVHGYRSRAAVITANAIASLKDVSRSSADDCSPILGLIMDRNVVLLPPAEAQQFVNFLGLPLRVELDQLITLYFQNWGSSCPILTKSAFLKNYIEFMNLLETSAERKVGTTGDSVEKFAANLVIVCALALLTGKTYSDGPQSLDLLLRYKSLVTEFVRANCILTKHCSVQSLQILAMALQFFLAVGDVATCYELRGRVITMAQQLRLHRCPAAVLGISKDSHNVNLQNYMQGERRILFWCVYSLDVYLSLNLGIPRLLKDNEIECAMPFCGRTDDDDLDNENVLIVNNTKLTIFGKVGKMALAVMQYSKVLGNIVDLVFTRSENVDIQQLALEKDRLLDCWRRDLPAELRFNVDVHSITLNEASHNPSQGSGNWSAYSKQQLTLIFLYHHARIITYLPIISKYGHHHNVGLSVKEQVSLKLGEVSAVMSSLSIVQQASIQILEILKAMTGPQPFLLPIAINIPREQARIALLVAKGSLEYIKGGPLFQNLRQLLLDTISILQRTTEANVPGCLTRNSLKMVEMAIITILGMAPPKNLALNLRKRAVSNQVTRIPSLSQPSQIPEQSLSMLKAEPFAVVENPTNLDYEAMISAAPIEASNSLDESLRDLFHFSPTGAEMTDFIADGSLGLAPILNEVAGESGDVSDPESTDAFQFGW